jgi:hypothetical protein
MVLVANVEFLKVELKSYASENRLFVRWISGMFPGHLNQSLKNCTLLIVDKTSVDERKEYYVQYIQE